MDKRYKIVNYATRHHRVEIDGKRPILWPFAIYSVNIPSVKEKDINIFEETVIKLISLNINDTESLSEEICLDISVVEFIVKKLKYQHSFTALFFVIRKKKITSLLVKNAYV